MHASGPFCNNVVNLVIAIFYYLAVDGMVLFTIDVSRLVLGWRDYWNVCRWDIARIPNQANNVWYSGDVVKVELDLV